MNVSNFGTATNLNTIRYSTADFATAIAKCVTENAEVVCTHAVGPPLTLVEDLHSV